MIGRLSNALPHLKGEIAATQRILHRCYYVHFRSILKIAINLLTPPGHFSPVWLRVATGNAFLAHERSVLGEAFTFGHEQLGSFRREDRRKRSKAKAGYIIIRIIIIIINRIGYNRAI